MSQIYVSTFQPFESRQGVDDVVSLRFRYNPDVVIDVKNAIRAARARLNKRNLGGWLPDHKAWFVEWCAWPLVRDRLLEEGYELHADEALADILFPPETPAPTPAPPAASPLSARPRYCFLCRGTPTAFVQLPPAGSELGLALPVCATCVSKGPGPFVGALQASRKTILHYGFVAPN